MTIHLDLLALMAVASLALGAKPNPSILVSGDWLADHLKDQALVVLHVGSQKDYDAQVLKYQLGTGQQIEVVQSQQTLAAANLAVVNAQIALRRALVALYLQTGELLDERGIAIK